MRWYSQPLVVLGLLSQSLVFAAHSFENTAVVRTVELAGGSLVHVTTTYAIKSLENGSRRYLVSLGEDEGRHTSWIEAKIKGQSNALKLEGHAFDPRE